MAFTQFGPAIGKEAVTNNISNWSCPGVPDYAVPSSVPLTGNPNHPIDHSGWSQVVIWHKADKSFQVTNTMIGVEMRSKPDQPSVPWSLSQGETIFSWAMRLLGWAQRWSGSRHTRRRGSWDHLSLRFRMPCIHPAFLSLAIQLFLDSHLSV